MIACAWKFHGQKWSLQAVLCVELQYLFVNVGPKQQFNSRAQGTTVRLDEDRHTTDRGIKGIGTLRTTLYDFFSRFAHGIKTGIAGYYLVGADISVLNANGIGTARRGKGALAALMRRILGTPP
jgi:hypothetical protein